MSVSKTIVLLLKNSQKKRGIRFTHLSHFLVFLVALWPTYLRAEPSDCTRIVSLAPSITETLYSLELGADLVANTEFCNFPEAAKEKIKVGGLLDPNLELILSLKPSVVFLLVEHTELAEKLRQLGLRVEMLEHRTLHGILTSISRIGEVCQKFEIAKDLRVKLESEIAIVEKQVRGLSKPRSMIVIGGMGEDDTFRHVYISGADGYFSDLLQIAGGENIYSGNTMSVPMLSAEGLLRLNPEVIIEIASLTPQTRPRYELDARARWSSVPGLKAIKDGRYALFYEDFAFIPGPRFPILLHRIAELLHPELRE